MFLKSNQLVFLFGEYEIKVTRQFVDYEYFGLFSCTLYYWTFSIWPWPYSWEGDARVDAGERGSGADDRAAQATNQRRRKRKRGWQDENTQRGRWIPVPTWRLREIHEIDSFKRLSKNCFWIMVWNTEKKIKRTKEALASSNNFDSYFTLSQWKFLRYYNNSSYDKGKTLIDGLERTRYAHDLVFLWFPHKICFRHVNVHLVYFP